MKKSTKPTKSPAPAIKSVPPASAPKTARKAASNPTASSVAKPKAVSKKAVIPTPPPAVKPAARVVTPVAAKPVVTVIAAKIDIGFGNALYVRGEGAGLSWDRGLLLDCVSDDQWSITLGESARPIVFKFLVNDLSWSTGEDYVVSPGSSAVLTPTF